MLAHAVWCYCSTLDGNVNGRMSNKPQRVRTPKRNPCGKSGLYCRLTPKSQALGLVKVPPPSWRTWMRVMRTPPASHLPV